MASVKFFYKFIADPDKKVVIFWVSVNIVDIRESFLLFIK